MSGMSGMSAKEGTGATAFRSDSSLFSHKIRGSCRQSTAWTASNDVNDADGLNDADGVNDAAARERSLSTWTA